MRKVWREAALLSYVATNLLLCFFPWALLPVCHVFPIPICGIISPPLSQMLFVFQLGQKGREAMLFSMWILFSSQGRRGGEPVCALSVQHKCSIIWKRTYRHRCAILPVHISQLQKKWDLSYFEYSKWGSSERKFWPWANNKFCVS